MAFLPAIVKLDNDVSLDNTRSLKVVVIVDERSSDLVIIVTMVSPVTKPLIKTPFVDTTPFATNSVLAVLPPATLQLFTSEAFVVT